MGSVSSRSQFAGQAKTANIPKPLKSRATYATVSNPPLDEKVEMTNWEKVSSRRSVSTRPRLTMGRVTTSTTSKGIYAGTDKADSRS